MAYTRSTRGGRYRKPARATRSGTGTRTRRAPARRAASGGREVRIVIETQSASAVARGPLSVPKRTTAGKAKY